MRHLAVVAALLWPVAALANGRAPITNGIQFRPGDNHSLYVAATFGLLISHDDGCSFRWVCEDNIGYGGTFDPKYRIAADGAIFATTFDGLRVSRDGGCSFATATAEQPEGEGRIAERWIDAIDIGPTGEVWVATADSGKPNEVYRSTDNGVTFEPRGRLSPSIWWKSLAVAPSRAQRVYLTGYQVAGTLPDGGKIPPTTHFQITDDGGATWSASALAGVKFGQMPQVYVLGVDAGDPDIVYMTSRGANPPTGDRLYRSADGGVTWTEVLAPSAAVLDLSVAPAGKVLVATLGGGAFQSTDSGESFTPMTNAPQLACVGERDDGRIYGCGANWEPDDKAVALSTDARTWSKVFRFVELAGPLECPAGTTQHDSCASKLWPSVREQFGATGPTCGIMPDETLPGPVAPPPDRAGCCDAGASTPGELGALAMLAAGCCAYVLRRRRTSSSSAVRQLG